MKPITNEQSKAIKEYFAKLDKRNGNMFFYDKKTVVFYRSINNDNLYFSYSYKEYVGGVICQCNTIKMCDKAGVICECNNEQSDGVFSAKFKEFCNGLIVDKNIKI